MLHEVDYMTVDVVAGTYQSLDMFSVVQLGKAQGISVEGELLQNRSCLLVMREKIGKV